MSFLNNPAKRKRRSSYFVSAYVGPNGSGKSVCMVHDCLPSLEAGRPALSTVRLQDYQNPRPCDDDWCASHPDLLDHFMMRPTKDGLATILRNQQALFFYGPNADQEPVERVSTGVHVAAHPGWIPWVNWQQLLTMKYGEVLADEMTGVAEARSSQSLPTFVINEFQQLRRYDTPFRYTLPSWEQADVSIRRPTQTVTLCRGFLPQQAPQREGDLERVIRIRRLYGWKTYEARLLTELTEGKRKDLKPEVTDWHWGPKGDAWKAYDTFSPVLTVGFPTQSGKCHRCGGNLPVVKCSCGTPDTHAATPKSVDAPARRREAPSTEAAADLGVAPGDRQTLELMTDDR